MNSAAMPLTRLAAFASEQMDVKFEDEGGQAVAPRPARDQVAALRIDERLGLVGQIDVKRVRAFTRKLDGADAAVVTEAFFDRRDDRRFARERFRL